MKTLLLAGIAALFLATGAVKYNNLTDAQLMQSGH
jgi:hypothetical protein